MIPSYYLTVRCSQESRFAGRGAYATEADALAAAHRFIARAPHGATAEVRDFHGLTLQTLHASTPTTERIAA